MVKKHPPKNTDPPPEEEEDLFEIDLNHLEEEWQSHPVKYQKAAKKLEDARKDHERAKANLKVVDADLHLDVRLHPDKYGVKDLRVTEALADYVVELQNDHRKAVEEVLETRYLAELLEAYVTTLEHQKKALEKEAELWLGGYWSTPHISSKTPRRDPRIPASRNTNHRKGNLS